MKRRLSFLFIALFLLSYAADACMCFNYLERSQEDLQSNYDYIALLTVDKVMAHPKTSSRYIFKFTTEEHLLGPELNQLTVNSYHPDFMSGPEKTSSSCDFLLIQGTTYLFFAHKEDGEFSTAYCGIVPLQHGDGNQMYGFKTANSLLESVRRAHNKVKPAPIQNGRYKEYHDNGQLKYKARYKNGRLQGSAKRWHKDGIKHLVERYANGQFHGKQKRWASNENYCIRYTNGVRTHEAYYFSSSPKEKYKREWYNDEGIVIRSEQYDQLGKLRQRSSFDPVTQWRTVERYNQGKLIARNEVNEKTGEEKVWNPQ